MKEINPHLVTAKYTDICLLKKFFSTDDMRKVYHRAIYKFFPDEKPNDFTKQFL